MKMYLYNIYFDFRSVTRFAKIWLLFSLDPPASFPYTTVLDWGQPDKISYKSE